MYTVSFDFAGSLHYTCDTKLSEAVSGAVRGAIADAFTNLTGYPYPDKFDVYDFMLALERENKAAWDALLDRACWEGLNVHAADEYGVWYTSRESWQQSGSTSLQSVQWLNDTGSLMLSLYYRVETGEFLAGYRDARRGIIDIWSTDVRGLVSQLERWALAHALDSLSGSGSKELEL